MPEDPCADDNGGDCNNGDLRHDTVPISADISDANEPTKENGDKVCLLLPPPLVFNLI